MKNEDFKNLIQGVKELKLYRQKKLKPSRVFNYDPDVKAIRAKLKMSQSEFADFLGVSANTVKNWEQKRALPVGTARSLLTIAEKEPQAVFAALHG